MLKLKPFKELIAMSKEKLDEAMAPLRAATAKSKANLEMAQIDEQIAVIEGQVNELAASKDINFHRIADLRDDASLLELRKKNLAEIVEQLFPVEA